MWIQRLIFGPRTWAGPQYDREYVVPRKLSLGAAVRAAEVMMEPLRLSGDPDVVGLSPIWEASGRSGVTIEELGALPESELGDVKVSAYGALLQLGRTEPAMVYYGNDESRERVLQGLAVLEREGRPLLRGGRFWGIVRLALYALLFVVAVVVEYATNVGGWAWIAAGVAVVFAVIDIRGRIVALRQPGPSAPHRVDFTEFR